MRTDDNPDPVAVAAALTDAFEAIRKDLGEVTAGERKNRLGVVLLTIALLAVITASSVTMILVRQHDIAARVAAEAAADRQLCMMGNRYRAADLRWTGEMLAAAPWQSSAAARADAARLRAEAAVKDALRDCEHLPASR